ncbi:kelch repeat-containing protein [Haliovirga abyssi]|uniref:Fibronectin type-III domain-containing protein n=1 Tax=Haliovirga abyssi TaxID=2996794 RepID=A0AAU9DM88_9FUSO|nr:kelch repeat-containing protein [Haliovirga abyssi]BDU51117.1 hypothetical protein HLVA_16860 [Haliovirga abyssi]
MKKVFKILMVVLFVLGIIGCFNQDKELKKSKAKLSFNYKLATIASKVVTKRTMRAPGAVKGTMKVTNITNSKIETFDWYGTLDEENFVAKSNSTIILSPGTYNIELIFTSGGYQYIGSALNQIIIDGTNNINLILKPVIGETSTTINMNQLTSLKLKYDTKELSVLKNPVIGMIVDNGDEVQFAINPEIGITEQYINLNMGEHNIKLKLYDDGVQIGKSVETQENVMLGLTDIDMDLIPLHGETVFNLTLDGGDAIFKFNIPKEVIEEVNGIENLKSIFKIVGPVNGLREQQLNLTLNNDGNYGAEITLSDYRYDKVTMTMEFYDASKNPEDIIGSSILENVELRKENQSLTYDLNLRRRAVATGNLLGVVGVNVFDAENLPVSGAKVYADGKLLGITGSGDFGTAGYLKSYLVKGDYTLMAEGNIYKGEATITLNALGIENKNIILNTLINNVPEAPSNPIPENGTTVTNGDLTLSWDCNDVDGDSLKYDIYLGVDSTYLPMVASNYVTSSYNVTGLVDSTYYWKVVAKDDKNGKSESSIWSFNIVPNNGLEILNRTRYSFDGTGMAPAYTNNDNYLYVFGGSTNSGTGTSDKVQKINLSDGSWETIATIPEEKRGYAGIALLSNKKLYISPYVIPGGGSLNEITVLDLTTSEFTYLNVNSSFKYYRDGAFVMDNKYFCKFEKDNNRLLRIDALTGVENNITNILNIPDLDRTAVFYESNKVYLVSKGELWYIDLAGDKTFKLVVNKDNYKIGYYSPYILKKGNYLYIFNIETSNGNYGQYNLITGDYKVFDGDLFENYYSRRPAFAFTNNKLWAAGGRKSNTELINKINMVEFK